MDRNKSDLGRGESRWKKEEDAEVEVGRTSPGSRENSSLVGRDGSSEEEQKRRKRKKKEFPRTR